MLEYIFFHEKPYQMFHEFTQLKGLSSTCCNEDGYIISLDENLNDQLQDEIDEKYDQLLEYNQQLMEEQDNNEHDYSMAAVDVVLADGRTSPAFIRPELMNSIMEVITPTQFSEVVKAITQAVENPDSRSFCERVRDDEDS